MSLLDLYFRLSVDVLIVLFLDRRLKTRKQRAEVRHPVFTDLR